MDGQLPKPRLSFSVETSGVPVRFPKSKNSSARNVNLLWLDHVRLEPLFDQQKVAHAKMFPKGMKDPQQLISNFAQRAFRGKRPSEALMSQLMKIYREEFAQTKSLVLALKVPYGIILSSPSFLYLSEEQQSNSKVSDINLATRLSMFLWSSPPDDELLSLAKRGRLGRQDVLLAQVDRMIEHPYFDRFIDGYVAQWLELDRLLSIDVNRNRYPSYSQAIKEASLLETKNFIKYLFLENDDAQEIINSHFSIMNQGLVDFYGIPVADVDGFEKVEYPESSPRRGILSHASLLTMTTNGDRTSPVERGTYILHKFLNVPKMQPPPNVPELSIDSVKSNASVRSALQQHSKLPQCASCHLLIDPLGYGMENFNAVGLWRDKEILFDVNERKIKKRKSKPKNTKPLDTSGQMPDGLRTFKGFIGLREHLSSDADLMLQGLVKSILIYSLGRPVGFQDEELLNEMVRFLKSDGQRMRTLLYSIVLSDAFLRS
jgi:hypothetical protein